jgi:hypothetical protein
MLASSPLFATVRHGERASLFASSPARLYARRAASSAASVATDSRCAVRPSFWRPLGRLPARGAKRNKGCPDHDGDIGYVEHTCPKRPNADGEKVHDAAAENSINPVRRAARNEQGEANTGGASEPISDRHSYEDQQRESGGNREHRGSRRTGQIRPQAQESAGVLRVAQSNGVRQI